MVDDTSLHYRGCYSLSWQSLSTNQQNEMFFFVTHIRLMTTRNMAFLAGDPCKSSFATVAGRGPHPNDNLSSINPLACLFIASLIPLDFLSHQPLHDPYPVIVLMASHVPSPSIPPRNTAVSQGLINHCFPLIRPYSTLISDEGPG